MGRPIAMKRTFIGLLRKLTGHPLFGVSGGYYATSVAAADVNGDGKPDLIVSNRCENQSDCLDTSEGSVGVLIKYQHRVYDNRTDLFT
jgi:hypothetical protein